MSGNGAPGPSGRGSRRVNRKRVQTTGSKPLGRVAQLAIRHNDEEAESFIEDLEAGHSTRLELGHVTRALGYGTFHVKVGGKEVTASLRGMLQGRGRFHHNPEATTAVRVGGWVVMDGEQIVSALSTGQATRARKALGMHSGRSSSSMFNRSSETRRNAVRRAALLKDVTNTRRPEPVRRSSSANRSETRRKGAGGGGGGRGWLSFF
jgi:hypothetical protein